MKFQCSRTLELIKQVNIFHKGGKMLTIKNVNTYINGQRIIKNINFNILPGGIVGLIGPNGAGKTTIMKTILGLTRFDGSINLNQHPITENNHVVLSDVGALIEHPAIYPFLTGFQNLALYSHDNKDMRHIVSLLKMNKYINKKSKNYSLGMKQKLGIAIALLNKPKLVILDEPMNGLDVESTIIVRTIIQQYAANGTAFLISSHILNELQKVMTQIILIKNGQIIVNQSIKEFNALNPQEYKMLTDNDDHTISILKANKITFLLHHNYILIENKNIKHIQDILYKNKIYLTELSPIANDFEQTIVKILEKQEK